MKLYILAFAVILLSQLAAVQCAPGANATCLSDCPRGGPYNPQCCDCCPGGTCSGNGAQFVTCCTPDQDFCGCISSRAFCSGRVANGGNLESTFGTCYAKGSGVCAYDPNPNVWIVCPTGTTGCIAGNTVASCCTSDQTCNRFTGFCESVTQTSDAVSSATCNGQAYDSTQYTCTINDQGQQVLCQTGYSSCGSACYQSSQYCCQDGELRQAGQCSVQTSQPTSSPTSQPPSSQPPSTGSSGTCNGQVYDQTNYDCPTNDQGQSVLCPKGNSACGSACYQSSQYCCQDGELRQAGQCTNGGGSSTCTGTGIGTPEDYDPSTSYCCSAIPERSGYKACPNGQLCCGGILNGTAYFGPQSLYTACYDPSQSKCCYGGTSNVVNPATIEPISYNPPEGAIRFCA